MQIEEIISSCNQAVAVQMVKGVRPSLQRPAELDSRLLNHVCDCLDCLFAIMDPTTSLAESGCEKFQRILREDGLLPLDSSSSPLAFAHVSDDMLEDYCFGRLDHFEKRGLEGHIALCVECAERAESQHEFVAVMKRALDETVTFSPNYSSAEDEPEWAKLPVRAFAAAAGS